MKEYAETRPAQRRFFEDERKLAERSKTYTPEIQVGDLYAGRLEGHFERLLMELYLADKDLYKKLFHKIIIEKTKF